MPYLLANHLVPQAATTLRAGEQMWGRGRVHTPGVGFVASQSLQHWVVTGLTVLIESPANGTIKTTKQTLFFS